MLNIGNHFTLSEPGIDVAVNMRKRYTDKKYVMKLITIWKMTLRNSVALFTKILTIKNCRKCKTKIKKSFTKILTIFLSVKIVLTLRVKLPCPKCKILIVREILVLSFIASEKNRKKDGRCIGAST
jgi:hypothetical protein